MNFNRYPNLLQRLNFSVARSQSGHKADFTHFYRLVRSIFFTVAFFLTTISLLDIVAKGAVITVSPADSPSAGYTKIQGAQAGDQVVIASGTYNYRIYLTGQGTAAQPITICAQDPNNKPVWNFSGTLVENAPGSYTGGDNGRGGWQVSGGANYVISGIVFSGCHNAAGDSAGLRYYGGTTGLLIRDCLFSSNDNGLTGGTENSNAIVEYCELTGNGYVGAAAPTHNIYIYGGTFTLRYSYVHDNLPSTGQNFHIRAQQAILEYNWFARAASYEGDLMTDDDFSGPGPFAQTMLLRGNIILQSRNPANHSQIIVAYNDTGLSNLTLNLQAINNTCIANGMPGNGGNAAFIHLSNADGTTMTGRISNNIIFGTTLPTLVENSTYGTVSGGYNWIAAGVSPGSLTNSAVSASPGFNNLSGDDFTLAAGSAAINGGDNSLALVPTEEYYQNEANPRQYRLRTSAKDIGAFESTTTGAGRNAYSPSPPVVAAFLTDGQDARLFIETMSSATYSVDRSDSLAPGSWGNLAANIAGTGDVILFVDSGAASLPKAFYRVDVLGP